ncbi:uncharacterized protein LOC129601191 [Paramacrobiotus metropolitanus]|uniref:uncharacterized protein LOC129601191 n=1 Tax=Paramacrobiotus metropolitanus TaxID=2943436 RepID=UPI002445B980|nr:uncharacterized protein LOC129601191 [Paramacrobiotus metropolitanus]
MTLPWITKPCAAFVMLFTGFCLVCVFCLLVDAADHRSKSDPRLTANWKLTISRTLSATPTRAKRDHRSSASSEEHRSRNRYWNSNGLLRMAPVNQSPARQNNALPVAMLLLFSGLGGGGGGGHIGGGGGGLLDGGGGGGEMGLLPGPPVPPAPGPGGGGDFDNLWNLIENYLFDTDPTAKLTARRPLAPPTLQLRRVADVPPADGALREKISSSAALLARPPAASEFRNARRPQRRRHL